MYYVTYYFRNHQELPQLFKPVHAIYFGKEPVRACQSPERGHGGDSASSARAQEKNPSEKKRQGGGGYRYKTFLYQWELEVPI